MSVINAQPFGLGFTGSSAEFEPTFGDVRGTAAQAQSDDIFTGSPVTLPIQSPRPIVLPAPGNGFSYGAPSNGDDGFGAAFNGILNQIGGIIQNIFAQLSASLASLAGASSTPTGAPETYYANATANSVGDPHLSFDGTNGDGTTLSGKWNSMTSHANLLSSDSFGGGFTESTVATTPDAKGVAYNRSATIATDGGATDVTLNNDGSYGVTQNGMNVTLHAGTATNLGNGETVTLESDGSLSVEAQNGSGGSIVTTLKSDGDGGVDVKNTATNIDLGGFLVDRSDDDPSAVAQASCEPALPYAGTFAGTPMVEGLQQFDPEFETSSLQNIELA